MAATSDAKGNRQALLDSAQRLMSHKGYAAVGLNEVLANAGVPKGSFYHYFRSKDVFGEALMQAYFTDYLADMDQVLAEPDQTAAERLMAYFVSWRQFQSLDDCQGKCLAVKLGAEVADLSESMRYALKDGVTAIVDRIERTIREGTEDSSITAGLEARATAEALYDLWLGASVVVKINRSAATFDTTMAATRELLGIEGDAHTTSARRA